MAISDRMNAVSDILDNLATQAPPAITAFGQAQFTAGQAAGGGAGDPNADAAATRMEASAAAAVAAIQGAVPAA